MSIFVIAIDGGNMLKIFFPIIVLVFIGACDDSTKPLLVPLDGRSHQERLSSFAAPCQTDSDCLSGFCISMGNSQKCTQACSGPSNCPPYQGWTCNAQSRCECIAQGVQPNQCNVDGDCDGQSDKPVQDEICNGEDDDCNDKIDDVAPNTAGAQKYYRDTDGDGFGDKQVSSWLCQPTAGWVTDQSDCDDTHKEAHPGLNEVCGNNIDEDCDDQIEDVDVCGYNPIVVSDIDANYDSIRLKSCTSGDITEKQMDITELLAKQDASRFKFTVRLASTPNLESCSSYTLFFGSRLEDGKSNTYSLVYIYRPAREICGKDFAEKEAYRNGQLISSSFITAFNAADPGHVSFVIPKSELLQYLPTPTYMLRACSNLPSDKTKDITECATDSCITPVHR